ncbi:hypothetical protein ABZ478_34975 [Streptomyces sp. NPDC005706]|uniref:hypothetical protein n=1 Tax=Streptomyces sp. NPDC005706 TaxID=3157169 RepID=UPI0033CE9D0E
MRSGHGERGRLGTGCDEKADGAGPAILRQAGHSVTGLGYIDERIHGLRQSGTATQFSLDLRDRGGRLCMAGSAAGTRTVVDMCVAPATGPFVPRQRKR